MADTPRRPVRSPHRTPEDRPSEWRRTRAPSHQPLRAQWDPVSGESTRPRPPRPDRGVRRQSRLGRFVATYGWRAYAVPVLAILTVIVGVDALRAGGDRPEPAAAGDAVAESGGVVGVPAPVADGTFPADLPSGALPEGGPFTAAGTGTWRVVPGTGDQVGTGRVYTYTVEIEDGVDTTGYGGDAAFARMVDETLANPKSWIQDPAFAFRRVDQGEPDFRVSLTSQMTIRQGCGYDIELEVSCFNPGVGRVLLNEPRWVRGAVAFQGDIGSYRQYLINHEIGHAIGFAAHEGCGSDGGLAPIMMQQSFGTANDDIAGLDPEGVVPRDGLTCRFNPWPYPRA
ncbi:conserved hypothetical protein [Rhodococcus ruber]|uniref:Peptidase metallopeptidase domain-containing protein n=1 Tax=Rhodococcus ruber TaxID=1830 RepID=A0A098BMH4_9NOCA|nr:conserved hypothetical protein [Rhodococcus ruber]